MTTFKVLVPLDGSKYAEHSLAFLPSLARMGDLEVTLVGVVDTGEILQEIRAPEVEETTSNLLRSYLHEIAADLKTHLHATVDTKVLHGEAAENIGDVARRTSPDCLVISTHGHSGLTRWQRGAVADHVIRGAEVPVLVVGPRAMEKGQWLEAEMVKPFKEILVPLDGSPRAEFALPEATKIARVFDSRIHLFRALPPISISSSFVEMPSTVWTEVVTAGEQYVAGVSSKVEAPGGVLSKVTVGAPVSEIDSYIQANNIDLVVMTSHGRGGIARAALGSVTDRVIGSGPPVLIVRTRE